MNDLEMLQALKENPMRKALCVIDVGGDDVKEYKDCCIVRGDNLLVWESGYAVTFNVNSKRQWEIIEPPRKLKEMSFGEAYCIWGKRGGIGASSIKSVITSKSFARQIDDISKEEYLSKWTIEGYYEDEEDEHDT